MIIVLLLLSVAAYVSVMLGMGYLGKRRFMNRTDLMYFNLVRNILSLILMAAIARSFTASRLTVILAACMGAASLLSSISSMLAYRFGPVSISILIINSLTMLLSSFAGPLFWHESLSVLQIIGMALCVVSMVLLSERSLVKKASLPWILALAGGAVGGGVQGPIQKVLASSPCAGENMGFVLYTFVFSTIVSAILLFAVRRRDGVDEKRTYKLKGTILLLFLSQAGLSVFLNINNLHLVAKLPTVVFFPTYSIGGLLFTSVISCLLFKEQLSKRQIFGVAAGLSALLLISGVLG